MELPTKEYNLTLLIQERNIDKIQTLLSTPDCDHWGKSDKGIFFTIIDTLRSSNDYSTTFQIFTLLINNKNLSPHIGDRNPHSSDFPADKEYPPRYRSPLTYACPKQFCPPTKWMVDVVTTLATHCNTGVNKSGSYCKI